MCSLSPIMDRANLGMISVHSCPRSSSIRLLIERMALVCRHLYESCGHFPSGALVESRDKAP